MNKKKRLSIPDEIADDVLYLSERTCCVCTIRGKSVQIHHIDEDPSNNSSSNLAVLCLECHNDTMINGGFGRKLSSSQVIKFRDEWIKRIKARRDKADELASIGSVTGIVENIVEYLEYKEGGKSEVLDEYLNKILIVQKALLAIAQTNWDSGVTALMNGGSSDMIDFYQEVLVELATFYPKGHFDDKHPRIYFSEYTSSRFQWHRSALEPMGPGTGGTIISTMTGGSVMNDLKIMVVDLVRSLITNIRNSVDFLKWEKKWLTGKI